MKKIIAGRLLEERQRLGLKKGEMATAGGIANSTYTNYEEGTRAPDGEFLAAIAAAGADVQYILTGNRTLPPPTEPLNPRVAALLDNYQHTDEQGKNIIEATAFAAAEQKKTINDR